MKECITIISPEIMEVLGVENYLDKLMKESDGVYIHRGYYYIDAWKRCRIYSEFGYKIDKLFESKGIKRFRFENVKFISHFKLDRMIDKEFPVKALEVYINHKRFLRKDIEYKIIIPIGKEESNAKNISDG